MPTDKPTKNALTVRLTESAVFLRPSEPTGRRRTGAADAPPSLLRGLLTLELAKPTKISSIDLELTAKTSTSWPEGVGARRIEVTEEHKVFYASTNFFHAGTAPRRNASVGPGIATLPDEEPLEFSRNGSHTPSREERGESYFPPRGRQARGMSADRAVFQQNEATHREDVFMDTPPYTPFPTSPSSEVPSLSRSGSVYDIDSAARMLEESRNALRAELHHEQRSPSMTHLYNRTPPHTVNSSASSIRSPSRRQSIDGVPENDHHYDVFDSHPHHSVSPHPSQATSSSATEGGTVSPDGRGRRHSKFSLTAVSNVLMDVVRSHSGSHGGRDGTLSRERNMPEDRSASRGTRGRSRIDEDSAVSVIDEEENHPHTAKERSTFLKIGDLLKHEGEDGKGGDGWKEFKKGTYTYAISFAIPGNAPPTLRTNLGSVIWRLKANVHRPGAFTSKLTATRVVRVIACPEDTDETENIVVERQWDSQLQYLISIAGRSFYIGGTIPIQFTLMPLAKIKIHRLSVYIEEKIDYYTGMKRIARTDPLGRIQLLTVKQPDSTKSTKHILPLDLESEFSDAPMYALLMPGDDPSEMASNLMGPGPWNFRQELQIPNACDLLRFTNKNRRSNITITHLLKVVIRVERGDDEHIDGKTGRRKLFDIVVQSPVHILSCRCNPEWASLPRYTETFDDGSDEAAFSICPCKLKAQEEARLRGSSTLERMISHRSTDSSASSAESTTMAITPATMPSLRDEGGVSLFQQNSLFEQLVSGQISESGEAPPTYRDATTSIPGNSSGSVIRGRAGHVLL